jgi:hypothetical protein
MHHRQCRRHQPLDRQRGLTLTGVALVSVVVAGLAMAALFSMRYDRNLFAEGAAKVGKLFAATPAQGALDAAKSAVGSATGAVSSNGGGAMRKCVIDGKTVISNSECSDKNPTSKAIVIHDSKGFEAPPKAVAPPAAATSDPVLDKAIEKQLH